MYSSAADNVDTEFRKRRTTNSRWNVFKKIEFTNDKQAKRQDVRVFLGYILLFSMGIVTLVLMQFLAKRTTISDSFPLSPFHQKMQETRHDDVINHHYDNFAVSILLPEEEFDSDVIHPSVTTFLKQINHLQVCNDMVAHTFVGGKKSKTIPFFQQAPELPRLERYIDSYLSMLEFAPKQDWYIQIDQDTYPFLENFQVFLKRYKPTNALFFHNFDVFPRDAKVIPQVEDKNHFPVSIMSRKAVEVMASKGYAKCILGYKHVPSLVTILVHCLEDMGVSVITEQTLHPTEPTHDFNWPADACSRPLSISNLSPQQMSQLFRSRPTTGSIDGMSYKWDTVVTYADIFHHTFSSRSPTPNIDRHTGTSLKKTAKSGIECKTFCEANKSCVSWTFVMESSECFMSPTAGVAIPRQSVISGLVPTRYNCN